MRLTTRQKFGVAAIVGAMALTIWAGSAAMDATVKLVATHLQAQQDSANETAAEETTPALTEAAAATSEADTAAAEAEAVTDGTDAAATVDQGCDALDETPATFETPAGDILISDALDTEEIPIDEWYTAEEAGLDLDNMEIIFDDEIGPRTDGSNLPDEPINTEEMFVREWGEAITYSWYVDFHDSVFSRKFSRKAGTYLWINSHYSPDSATGYPGYVSPDLKCHVLTAAGHDYSRKIQLTQTGGYRIAFFNRCNKRIYVEGFYRFSY